ncbi:MAG: hypothetical protein N2450_02880 [bacterium]|nr:hypothetical protein [bacterium]
MNLDNEQLPNEDLLREQIRKKLEEQSQKIQEELERLRSKDEKTVEAERYRKLLEEERARYYQSKGYVKVVAEDGTVEWIPKERAKALEDRIGEEIDDLEAGQKRVLWFVVGVVMLMILLALILFFLFWPRPGAIRVVTNVPKASIILNNDTTIFVTDTVITDLEAGKHILSVYKKGYKIVGEPYRAIDLKSGSEILIAFELEPAPEPVKIIETKTPTVVEEDTFLTRIRQKAAEIEAKLNQPQ